MRSPPPHCEHAHAPPLYDAGHSGDLHWSLQRFHGGRTLAQLTESNPLTPLRAVSIIHRIADTLCFAHAQGLVHLDVKPANIMLGKHGDVVLIDWDGAIRNQNEPASQGTLGYMPPEQAEGKSCDGRADIYSLGATLLHILGGRKPSAGWWPPFLKGRRHRELRAIVEHAMSANLNDRYSDMQAMTKDLQAWLDGQAPSVLPEGSIRRCYRRMKRHPITSAALILTASSSLLIFWQNLTWLRQRQQHWNVVIDQKFNKPLDTELWEAWALPNWQTRHLLNLPLGDESSIWRVESGSLVSAHDPNWEGAINLSRGNLLLRDFSMSWTVTPLVSSANCNAYLGKHREQLYQLHIAGFQEPDLVMLSGPPLVTPIATAQLPYAIEVGESYDIRWVYTSRVMQVYVNNLLLIDHQLPSRLAPEHIQAFGFETGSNQVRITSLTIKQLNIPQVLSRFQLAAIYESQGEYLRADQILSLLPQDAPTLLARARCAEGKQQHQIARQYLLQLLELDHTATDARLLLAEWHFKQGQSTAAINQLEAISSIPQTLHTRALSLLDQILSQRFDQSVSLFDIQSIKNAIPDLATQWKKWLKRWGINLHTWNRHLLPSLLIKKSTMLVNILLYHEVERHLAPLHAAIPTRPLIPHSTQSKKLIPVVRPTYPLPSTRQTFPFTISTGELPLNRIQMRTHQINDRSSYTLRRNINISLIESCMDGNITALNESIKQAQSLVRRVALFNEEVFFPAMILAAIGDTLAAKRHIRLMVQSYPADHLPDWQMLCHDLLNNRPIKRPNTTPYNMPEQTILEALQAELQLQHTHATQLYTQSHFHRDPHWQLFRQWRLGDK